MRLRSPRSVTAQNGMRRKVAAYFDRRARSETRPAAPGGDESGLIARMVNERAQGRVLEIGCGTAPSAQGGRERQRVAMDISISSLKRVVQGPLRVCGDATCMPFRFEAFDTAVSVHMFHHLVGGSPGGSRRRLEAALKGIAMVLHPDGVLTVVDTVIAGWLYPVERALFPFVMFVAGLLHAPPVMFRSLDLLVSALAEAGFVVREARALSPSGKALTPWGTSWAWPMRLSPLRDAFVVAQKVASQGQGTAGAEAGMSTKGLAGEGGPIG